MGGERIKVLLCDDDPLLLDLLEFRLRAKGYDVARAADGEEAFERVRRETPDVIVLDAMMPKSDGFQVLNRVKRDELLSGIPILMLTARKSERDIVTALENGADDYLVKPFIPEELLARLTRLVARGGGRG